MTTTGTLVDRLSYVRFGAGDRHLVVLPGMALRNAPPGPLTARGYAYAFRHLAAGRTVSIVQRPRPLPAGGGTREIAAAYAEALAGTGPVDVLGFSTGGLIAQYLAADHPDLVARLALAVSGVRLSPRGREICQNWLDLAVARKWRRLHGELGAVAVDGPAAQRLARLLLPLAGRTPSDVEAADFVAAVTAVLDHDATADLPALRMPVLVAGGEDDVFFPAPLLRETATLARAELHLHPGGHGVPKHRGAQLQRQVAAFLAQK